MDELCLHLCSEVLYSILCLNLCLEVLYSISFDTSSVPLLGGALVYMDSCSWYIKAGPIFSTILFWQTILFWLSCISEVIVTYISTVQCISKSWYLRKGFFAKVCKIIKSNNKKIVCHMDVPWGIKSYCMKEYQKIWMRENGLAFPHKIDQ